MNIYDPLKQLNYLRQALSNNKRPIGLFLSAGCPLSIRVNNNVEEPLIPDISGLTNKICNVLSMDDSSRYCEICYAVCSNTKTSPNIEKILSHVRTLKQIIYSGNFNGFTKNSLAVLEKQICDTITQEVSKSLPYEDSPYHKLAAWIGSIERDFPINIFTTNYDLLMEQALEECRVPFFDGFNGSKKAFFDIREIEEDRLPSHWARIWKLHGSVNWHYDETSKVVWRGEGNTGVSLIHPSHLKYDQSRRMPYLAMIDRLKAFIKLKGCVILICGYSFNDDHINEVIEQGLQNNPLAMVFGLLYGNLDKYQNAKQLTRSRSNLSLLAKDGAIIGKQEGRWAIDNIDRINSNTKRIITLVETEGEQTAVQLNIGDFSKLALFLEEMLHDEIVNESSHDASAGETELLGGVVVV